LNTLLSLAALAAVREWFLTATVVAAALVDLGQELVTLCLPAQLTQSP